MAYQTRIEFKKGEQVVDVREHDCEIEPWNQEKSMAWVKEQTAHALNIGATSWHAMLQEKTP